MNRIVLLCCVFLCISFAGCSSRKPSAEKNVVEEKPEDVSGIELVCPITEKNPVLKPTPLSVLAIKDLTPEQFEDAVMKSFSGSSLPDDENVRKVRKAADKGDDMAREKLAMYYLCFPKTDDRYLLGVDYLNHVEEYRNNESLKARAMLGYERYTDDLSKTREFFERIIQTCDEPTLKWLLDHEDIGLDTEAWNRLKDLTLGMLSQGKDGEVYYKLAELYNFYPKFRDWEQFEQWIVKSSDLNYPAALYVHGMMLLHKHDAEKGLDLIKKSAEMGHDEANALLSSYYLVAILKNTAEEAESYSDGEVFPDLYQLMRKELINPQTGQETVGGFMRIANYASNSEGLDKGCKVLFALSAAKDWWTDKVKDASIDCLESFVDRAKIRAECDSIDNMYSFEEEIYEKEFDAVQRKRISDLRIKCYERMVSSGIEYDGSEIHVLSSSSRLGMLYSGDVDTNVQTNPMLYAQYTVFAAVRNEDIVARMALAQGYITGEFYGIKGISRACYWSTRVVQDSVCVNLCKTIAADGTESIILDEDVTADEAEMIMMVCTVCQTAREYVSEYCGS